MTNIESIARELAEKKNITIKLATDLVKSTFEIAGSQLSTKNDVYIKNFGTFSVKARQCRKPNTDVTFMKNVVHFKAFKQLKAGVN